MKANAAEVSALPPEPAHHGGLAGVHTGVWLLNLETQEESITPDGSSALSVEVLRSNASGSVLIGVIPDSGGGRVGVISGNEFTPLPATVASEPSLSGTW